MDGGGYWGSQPAGNSPAAWLEKPKQLEEGPGVLSRYEGPGEFGVLLCGCSLTSRSPQYCTKLCFGVLEKLQEDR